MLFLTYVHGKGVKNTIEVKKAIIFRFFRFVRFFPRMRLKIISARPISKSASPFHDLLRYLNQSNRVPMGSEEVEAKPFFMMLGSRTTTTNYNTEMRTYFEL